MVCIGNIIDAVISMSCSRGIFALKLSSFPLVCRQIGKKKGTYLRLIIILGNVFIKV